MKPGARNFGGTAAVNGFLGVQKPTLHRSKAGDHFERRPRRVGPLHRFGGQRAVDIFVQPGPVGNRNSAHKQVGVKSGGRSNSPQIAGLAINDHGGRTFALQPRLAVTLQPAVDGQLDIGAGNPLLAVQFAHHPAHGVHLDPLGAGRPAQVALHFQLDPGFADLEFRDLQQRVGVFKLGQIIIADRADIAHHMRHIGPQRIAARQAHVGGDAGQGGGVDGDFCHIFPCNPVDDGDRHKG